MRFCPDEWMTDLDVDLHDEPFRDRLERRLWLLAQDLLERGQSVILESGFWSRAERDEKRLKAWELGATVELHYFDVPLEELWRRIQRRNEAVPQAHVTRSQLEEWATWFQPPDRQELEAYDSYNIITLSGPLPGRPQ